MKGEQTDSKCLATTQVDWTSGIGTMTKMITDIVKMITDIVNINHGSRIPAINISYLIKKHDLTICFLHDTHFKYKVTRRLGSKWPRKICHANTHKTK